MNCFNAYLLNSLNFYFFEFCSRNQDTIFISDNKKKKIYFINKNDGSGVFTMDLTTEPFGLSVYGPNQLPIGNTPCKVALSINLCYFHHHINNSNFTPPAPITTITTTTAAAAVARRRKGQQQQQQQ